MNLSGVVAQAAQPAPTRLTPPPAASGTPAPAATSPVATISQPITVQAGTGVLLRLPQPAATVMSAEPGVARVQPASPTSLFLMGVAPGRTTVIATTDAGQAIVQYDVTVTPGAAALPPAAAAATAPSVPATALAIQAAIARTVQGASAVRVQGAGTDAILTGTVPNAAAAQQAEAIARGYVGDKGGVVDNLTVLGAIQVNVRVRIAEINRSVTRQLGFNWQALGSGPAGASGCGPAPPPPARSRRCCRLASRRSPAPPPPSISSAPDSPPATSCGTSTTSSMRWPAISSSPSWRSPTSRRFRARPRASWPAASSRSRSPAVPPTARPRITVEFKTFGVSLAVVPTVMSPTRLNLRVRPEVSQLTTNGAVSVPLAGGTLTIPALTVRRAETTVELGSGQSFAIAGLLQKTSLDQTNALPWIGEIPVIGALFKSNDFQRGESELVIIVTPYVVQPASSPTALRTPMDGFRPATDLDRILLGRQLAPRPSGRTATGCRLHPEVRKACTASVG